MAAELMDDFAPIYAAFLRHCRPVPSKVVRVLRECGLEEGSVRQFGLHYYFHGYRAAMRDLAKQFGSRRLIDAGLIIETPPSRSNPRAPRMVGVFEPYRAAAVPYMLIPYLRAGRPVHLKARPLCSTSHLGRLNLPTSLSTGPTPPCWFNIDALARTKVIVILRRELDAMAAGAADVAALACGNLSNINVDWLRFLEGKHVMLVQPERRKDDRQMAKVAELFTRAQLPRPDLIAIPDGIAGSKLARFLHESMSLLRLGDSASADKDDLQAQDMPGFNDLLEHDANAAMAAHSTMGEFIELEDNDPSNQSAAGGSFAGGPISGTFSGTGPISGSFASRDVIPAGSPDPMAAHDPLSTGGDPFSPPGAERAPGVRGGLELDDDASAESSFEQLGLSPEADDGALLMNPHVEEEDGSPAQELPLLAPSGAYPSPGPAAPRGAGAGRFGEFPIEEEPLEVPPELQSDDLSMLREQDDPTPAPEIDDSPLTLDDDSGPFRPRKKSAAAANGPPSMQTPGPAFIAAIPVSLEVSLVMHLVVQGRQRFLACQYWESHNGGERRPQGQPWLLPLDQTQAVMAAIGAANRGQPATERPNWLKPGAGSVRS